MFILETGEPLVESGGGGGRQFGVWFGSLEDLIQRLYLFVEVGIRLFQFTGGVFQAGFLGGRKRSKKILVADAGSGNRLIQGGGAFGERRRSVDLAQRFAKSVQLIAGSFGVL